MAREDNGQSKLWKQDVKEVVVVEESNSYSNQIAGHTSSKRPGGVTHTTEDIVDCYSFVQIN